MTAVFDFDGTLFRGDSFVAFARTSLPRSRFIGGLLLAAPQLVAWKLGLTSSSKAKQALFGRWWGGTPAEEFARLGREFAGVVATRTNAEVLAAMERHLAAGRRVCIASASIADWIAPWASRLPGVKVVATKAEVTGGRLTGRFDGPNCLGEEKVRRLKALWGDDALRDMVLYTDSRADAPLMALARQTFMVGKDGVPRPLNSSASAEG